jgi:hypothetical protein
MASSQMLSAATGHPTQRKNRCSSQFLSCIDRKLTDSWNCEVFHGGHARRYPGRAADASLAAMAHRTTLTERITGTAA